MITKFHKLFDDPLVCVISSGLRFKSGIKAAIQLAQDKECSIIVQPSWYIPKQAKQIAQITREVKRHFPKISFYFICPTNFETNYLKEMGLDSLHIHKNAFIDTNIFIPDTEEKIYNAVHIANVMPFKRHFLAWEVPNIAVVTYDYTGQKRQFEEIAGYKHLAYANFKITNGLAKLDEHSKSEESLASKMSLTPMEVKKIICQSNCGIILSEEEGANLASTEYLLCGIPVVSTKSVGGREELFDFRHVLMVEPHANRVENAVRLFQELKIDRLEIRNSVMDKIRIHRHRFINFLSQITSKDLMSEVDADFWHPNFTNKLMNRFEIDANENYNIDILKEAEV